MRKHHPALTQVLARFRRRRRKKLKLPPPVRAYEDRLFHAELEANSALYEAPDNPTPEGILIARDRAATLDRLLNERVDARHARVVRLHCGLGCEAQTLDQIGEQYGVSRERIRQMEWTGLRKLRHPSCARHLDNPYYGRWHGKAQRNLYVPEWKREEERREEERIYAERQKHHARAQRLADERVLAEAEQRRAERERAQAEVVAARELLHNRLFDLDPAHVAEYARALTDMLTQARQARWL